MPRRVLQKPICEDSSNGRDEQQEDVVPDWEARRPPVLGGNDEDRPMPEIERVRDQSKELKRSLPKEALDALGPAPPCPQR